MNILCGCRARGLACAVSHHICHKTLSKHLIGERNGVSVRELGLRNENIHDLLDGVAVPVGLRKLIHVGDTRCSIKGNDEELV